MAAAAARKARPEGDNRPPSTVDVAELHAWADRLADAHARAPVAAGGAPFRQRLMEMARTSAQRGMIALQGSDIERRARAGRVRMLDEDGPADVLFDLGRMLAAWIQAGRTSEASIVANRYLDLSPQGATGWALLPLMLSMHIEDAAEADRLLEPARPQLIAIAGLSGTGKSSLARLLCGYFGRRPGARVLRSDVFRKRLAGLPPEGRLPPSHYTRRSDAETYEALFESADDHLACGSTVILDAVFLNRSEREVTQALASQARVPFTGIWLEAPERDRIARVMARTGDASDATAEVAREQARRSVGDMFGWHRMRANRPMELIVPAARAIIERTRR